MRQSKLIEILRRLSPRQLGRYSDFVRSPYFNKNDENLRLFQYIEKYAPAFDHKNLERDVVLKKMATTKPLDEKTLANLMSQQVALLEKFLAVEYQLADEFGQGLALMEQYQAMQLPKRQKQAGDAAAKAVGQDAWRNADYFRQQVLLKTSLYRHSDPSVRGFNPHLQAVADALDAYFLSEKLRQACLMENLSGALLTGYSLRYLEEVLEWSGQAEALQLPAVQIYRGILLLLRNEKDATAFSEVKKLLSENEKLFSNEEKKQLYTLLLNYCARRINRFNDKVFQHEYLEINKLLLANGLLFEQGQLTPWRYTNIAKAGLNTGQNEWTWNFIHQFKGSLPHDFTESVFSYNLAQYHYHLGDLDKAQRSLLHVDIAEDVLLNISGRSLLIKIYHETDQPELLLSYLEATRQFLMRNQLLDAQLKRQMQKFVEVTAKPTRYGKPERQRLVELFEHLPPADELMHHDWLEEQIRLKIKEL